MAPLVRVVCWRPEKAAQRARAIQGAGFCVDASPLRTSGLVGKIRDAEPAAVVIDLDAAPSHGRAVAMVLRSSKSTRQIPIVFAGGVEEKVARLRAEMPECCFTTWEKAGSAIGSVIRTGAAAPVEAKSYMQQWSGTVLSKKLDLKPGMKVAMLGAPAGFFETLVDLPDGIEFTESIVGGVKLALWFVRSGAELEAETGFVCARLPKDASLWIVFPKQSGRLRSDFSKLDVQRAALAQGMVDYKICSVDADWSGMKFARKRH